VGSGLGGAGKYGPHASPRLSLVNPAFGYQDCNMSKKRPKSVLLAVRSVAEMSFGADRRYFDRGSPQGIFSVESILVPVLWNGLGAQHLRCTLSKNHQALVQINLLEASVGRLSSCDVQSRTCCTLMQCTGKQSTDLRYSQPLSLSTGLSTSMKRRVSQVPHIWHIVSLIYSGTSASAKRILVLTHDQAVTRLFFGSSFLIRRQGTCAVMMWSLTQLTTIHVEYMSQTTYSLAYIDTQYIFGSCRTLQRNGGAECMHKHMQHRVGALVERAEEGFNGAFSQ
jgi:hypothetical protein